MTFISTRGRASLELLKGREQVWADKNDYDTTAKKLATLFIKNFAAYEEGVSKEVKAAGPAASA